MCAPGRTEFSLAPSPGNLPALGSIASSPGRTGLRPPTLISRQLHCRSCCCRLLESQKFLAPPPPRPMPAGLFLLQSQLLQLWDNVPGEAGQLTPHFPLLAPIHHQHRKVPTTAPAHASWQPGRWGRGGARKGMSCPRLRPPTPGHNAGAPTVPSSVSCAWSSSGCRDFIDPPNAKTCLAPALPTLPRPGPRGRYKS